MHAVEDNDIELLEAYLDEALAEAERDAVKRRLASEPDLAAALESIRAERSLRQTFFRGIEPDEAVAEDVLMRLRQAIDRQSEPVVFRRALWWTTAVAACIAVGLALQWFWHDAGRPENPRPQATAVVWEVVIEDGEGGSAVQRFGTQEEADRFKRSFEAAQRRAVEAGGMDAAAMLAQDL